MQRFRLSKIVPVLMSAAIMTLPLLRAAPVRAEADTAQARQEAINRGVDYLKSKAGDDGSFSGATGPAVTALVTTALLRSGRTVSDPFIAKSLKYLESFVQPDGGIYQPETNYKNYESCLAIVCFSHANSGGHYTELLKRADGFVKSLQWDESEDIDSSNFSYGGAGYGRSKRPDLSNTAFLMDALKSTGTDANHDAIKKALVFISRCQNLESENNTTEFSAKNPDGGFYYTPAAGGSSQAGKSEAGGLRSYGSMTYAGLKSMIYAGLTADDPRVKAATNWLKQNYALDSNPGMGDSGLFYYYDTFAKALDATGSETFTDASGTAHKWRDELTTELVKRQKPDGSWVNANERWMEGDSNLVTGYALLALSYCRPQK